MLINTGAFEIEAVEGGSVYIDGDKLGVYSLWDTLKPEAIPKIQATIQQIKALSNDLTKLILGAVQPGEEETVIVCKDIDTIGAINQQHYI